ncbi:hypothetical protein HPB47_025274, partial [Ixodes persulcatus]
MRCVVVLLVLHLTLVVSQDPASSSLDALGKQEGLFLGFDLARAGRPAKPPAEKKNKKLDRAKLEAEAKAKQAARPIKQRKALKRAIIACYLEKMALERRGMNAFVIPAIPTELCTHVVYSYLKVDQRSGRLVFRTFDYSTDMSSLRKLYYLKRSNSDLKLIITYGNGKNAGELMRVIGSRRRRDEFVDSTVLLILRFGFDGLNLHWEGPGPSICKPNLDKLYRFLKELKLALEKHNLELSVMLPACRLTCPGDLNMWKLAQYVDFLHLIAYDYYAKKLENTASYSALFSQGQENTEGCMTDWVDSGVRRDQMVVGLSALGRNYNMPTNGSFTMNAPTMTDEPLGSPGFLTQARGYLCYPEICRNTLYYNWKKEWDGATNTPYAYCSDELVSYDDADSVWIKTRWLRNHAVAGVFLWSLGYDDYNGQCGGSYPLLRKMNEALQGYVPPFDGEYPMPHYGVKLKCSNDSQTTPDYTDCK